MYRLVVKNKHRIFKYKSLLQFMKTADGRFIERRIKLPMCLIDKILKRIKIKNNFTWNEFSKKIGVCTQTLRVDWTLKGNTIPESIFKKLIALDTSIARSIHGKVRIINPFWGQKKGADSTKEKLNSLITIPDINTPGFAEFYGIMLGDGCIYSNLNGFCIAGDSISDKAFHENYIKKLIFDLFKIEPKIYYSKQSNSIRCNVYSRKISRFLIEQGFPAGKKKFGNLEIPSFILKNENLIKSCIRGLNDTDGTICQHPHSKIMLQISITVPSLLNSCKKAFNKLNFDAGFYNKGVNLYGKDKIKKYFDIIGSSNPKHLTKFKMFLKTGKVPSKQETESFLRKENVTTTVGP